MTFPMEENDIRIKHVLPSSQTTSMAIGQPHHVGVRRKRDIVLPVAHGPNTGWLFDRSAVIVTNGAEYGQEEACEPTDGCVSGNYTP